MQNTVTNNYSLNLEECVKLILSIGNKRTVLLQGDMGNGKRTSVLQMLAKTYQLTCHATWIAQRKT